MSLYDGNEHGDDGSVHQLDQQSIADAHMQNMLAMNEASMLSDMSAGMLPVDFDPTGTSPHHLDDFAQEYEKDLQLQSDDPMDLQGLQSENGMSTSGVGAGPLPTGFGAGPAPGAGSILTDFTKRRNWSQRVVEELKDFLHILTPDGRFLYVSPSAKSLTGYHSTQLVGRFISDFLHSDDNAMFVREFNESIATGNPLRFFYRFKKFDGSYAIFESHGHPHLASEAAAFGPNSGASFCRGFFMMARPYPTKNAALLDSFLEHKIENERLRKRIADLKREEQDDLEGSQPRPVPAGKSESGVPGGQRSITGDSTSSPANFGDMPPPAKPSLTSNALTRQNLDEALAASRPDSINDKMARYEGATHIETIEMLTGLRYRDGERSKGISTGAKSPSLIRGDAGIAIPVDKDGRRTPGRYTGSPYDLGSIDKKKRMKVADEYVCTDCGTLDSPEWRKGPSGPKTLCNACGLRWAKKEKRSKSDGKSSGNGNGSGNGHGHSSVKNSSQDTPMSEATRYSHGTQQHIQPGMSSIMSQSQSSMSTPMGAQMSPMASMHSMQMAGVPNLMTQTSITPSSSSPLATMPVVMPGDPNQGNPGYS